MMKMIYLLVIYNKRHSSRFLLILGLCLLCIDGGKCLVLETSVGSDAVLPCSVGSSVDATDLAVEWSRPDLPPEQYVHFQRLGREVNDGKNPPYEGRTSLFVGELKNGNVSLKLSRVELSDAGIYTCYIPEIKAQCTVQLLVEPMKEVPVDYEDKPEFSPAGALPWWGVLIVIFSITTIVIFASVLVCKKSLQGSWKRSNSAGSGDRSKDGFSEDSPMHGVSVA